MQRRTYLTKISMLPLIEPDDKLFIRKTKDLKVNDIVAFKKDSKLIAHRVIYIFPEIKQLITKGDNNLKSDGVVNRSSVLGIVEKIERKNEVVNLNHVYLTQSSAYLKGIKKIVRKLNVANIDYILLKGLPIHLIYGLKKPNRIYFDCDILIKKKDFIATKKLLNRLGYIHKKTLLFNLSPDTTQYTFVKNTRPFPVIVDLHLEPAIGLTKVSSSTSLIPCLEEFTNFLFKNERKEYINKEKMNVLNTEVFVLYLLLHLYHHNFKGSHRINFIKEVVKKNEVDWKKVSKLANNFQFLNFIYPACLTVNKLYKNTIPKSFFKTVTPSFIPNKLSIFIYQHTSFFDDEKRTIAGIKRFILLLLLSPTSLLSKIRTLLSKEVLNYFSASIKSLFSNSTKKSSKSFSA